MTDTKKALDAFTRLERLCSAMPTIGYCHAVPELETIRTALLEVDGLKEEKKMRKEYFLQTCNLTTENTRLKDELAALKESCHLKGAECCGLTVKGDAVTSDGTAVNQAYALSDVRTGLTSPATPKEPIK